MMMIIIMSMLINYYLLLFLVIIQACIVVQFIKNYTFLIIFNQALHCLAAIINKIYKPSYKSNQVSVKWSDPLNLLFFI